MATIGKLHIQLSSSIGPFVQGIGRASKTVKSFSKSLVEVINPFTMVKGLLGGLAVGGLLAFAKHAITSAAALARTSRLMGMTASSVATLQSAVRGLGGDAESVVNGLQHFNGILSGLGEKSNYAAMLLSNFGLTLKDVDTGDLTGIKKIADAIASTTNPLQRATLAEGLFGEGARDLLPILAQGSKGIEDLEERAKKMGRTFTDLQGLKLEALNGELNKAGDMVDSIGRQSAVQLAERFYEAAGAVDKIANAIGGVDKLVKNVFRAFSIGWSAVMIGGIAVAASIQLGFVKLFEYISSALAKVFHFLAKLPEAMGGNTFKGFEDSLTGMANATHTAAGQIKSEAMTAIQEWGKDIERGFDDVGKTVNSKPILDFGKKLNAGGAVQALERYKSAIGQFAGVLAAAQSPFETFKDKLAQLKAYLEGSGPKALDSYARGIANIVAELEKAHGLHEIKLAGAVQAGSTAAASAINQSEALNNRRLRERPEDRVARILEQSKEIEREQLEQQRRIADAVSRRPELARIP